MALIIDATGLLIHKVLQNHHWNETPESETTSAIKKKTSLVVLLDSSFIIKHWFSKFLWINCKMILSFLSVGIISSTKKQNWIVQSIYYWHHQVHLYQMSRILCHLLVRICRHYVFTEKLLHWVKSNLLCSYPQLISFGIPFATTFTFEICKTLVSESWCYFLNLLLVSH
jgi:hypothetical protein